MNGRKIKLVDQGRRRRPDAVEVRLPAARGQRRVRHHRRDVLDRRVARISRPRGSRSLDGASRRATRSTRTCSVRVPPLPRPTRPSERTRSPQFARAKGATKLANLAFADPFGPPRIRVQAKVFEKLGGKEVLSVLDLPLENADFTAIIQKIKDTRCGLHPSRVQPADHRAVRKGLAQAGIHPKVAMLGQGYQEDILKALGSAAEGLSFSLGVRAVRAEASRPRAVSARDSPRSRRVSHAASSRWSDGSARRRS